MSAVVDAATRSLDRIEEFAARDVAPPSFIDIDDIEAECTVLSQLDIDEQSSSNMVTVSCPSHHVGVTDAVEIPNSRTNLLQVTLEAIDRRTDDSVAVPNADQFQPGVAAGLRKARNGVGTIHSTVR